MLYGSHNNDVRDKKKLRKRKNASWAFIKFVTGFLSLPAGNFF